MPSVAMTGDLRKQFLLQQTSAYFGLAITDPVIEGIAGSEKVNNFLDDGNSLVLSANLETRSDGEFRIHLDNAPSPGQSEDRVLLFFKRRPDVLNPENMHKDIFISSMADSPVSALYHALHKVYSPLLLKDPKWSTEFDPKLQGLLTELEKVTKGQSEGKETHYAGPWFHPETPGPRQLQGRRHRRCFRQVLCLLVMFSTLLSLSLILTPFDETQYWADMANSPKNRGER